MENAWSYVAAGYGITIVALATYLTWLLRRTRRLRRVLASDADG